MMDIDWDKAESIKLYHYTTEEAADNIVKTGELWLTDVNSLDDGNEMNSRFETFKKQIISSKGFKNLSIRAQNIFEQRFINNIHKGEFFIGCFCHTEKNKHLWDKYAGKFTGKCFEFILPLPVGEDRRFPLQMVPMQYDDNAECPKLQSKLDNLQYTDFYEIDEIFRRNREGRRRKLLHKQPGYIELRDTLTMNYLMYCLGTKSTRYKEEREFRLIASQRMETWFDETRICYEAGKRRLKFPIPPNFFSGTSYSVPPENISV